ncbi:MAG: TetR/AcrR family fatty acid metabolism transcriptional regulator [Myxococcota bacterium]|jgi:TetR/AcrR family fatty acid metabolism transcriptional regulator
MHAVDPPIEHPTLESGPHYSDRHREVLMAAMTLIAERGLGAASLRELARRLSMSQPSLYHYFSSKDELVEQVITNYTSALLRRSLADTPTTPLSLRELLTMLLERTLAIWEENPHATFVRFMFAVTMEKPEHGDSLRRHLLDRLPVLCGPWLEHLVASGELRADDAPMLIDLCFGALQMRLIKRRVLCAGTETPGELSEFVAFIVDFLTAGAQARARRKD